MEKLWAPWRLEYVRHARDNGCFLCRILGDGDDRANLVVKRGCTSAIVMNRYPYNNGHLMVCPRRHVAELPALDREERLEIMDLAAECVSALRATVFPHGFNLGLNLGRAAGAGLEAHLHVHVVPRWEGDTNFMPVAADVKIIPQALDDLWLELRRALNP